MAYWISMWVLKAVLAVVNSLAFAVLLFICYQALKPRLITNISARTWSERKAELVIAYLNISGTVLLLFTSITGSVGGMCTPSMSICLPFQLSLISPFIGLVPILLAHDMQVALLKLPAVRNKPRSAKGSRSR